jgi:hypothetical protein
MTLRRLALRTLKLGVDSGMQRVTDDRWRRAPPNRFRPNLLRLDWGSPQKKRRRSRGLCARGKSEHHQATRRVEHAGSPAQRLGSRKVSQKTNRPVDEIYRKECLDNRVRVKRRGKSPPPVRQLAGHEKPRVVQDKTGDARRLARRVKRKPEPRKRNRLIRTRPSPGISRTLPRRSVPFRRDERNDRHGRLARAPRQNSAYRHPLQI